MRRARSLERIENVRNVDIQLRALADLPAHTDAQTGGGLGLHVPGVRAIEPDPALIVESLAAHRFPVQRRDEFEAARPSAIAADFAFLEATHRGHAAQTELLARNEALRGFL